MAIRRTGRKRVPHDRVIHRLTCVLVKLADGLMIQQVLRVGTSKFDGGTARFFVRNTLKRPGDVLDTKTVVGPANVPKGLSMAEESFHEAEQTRIPPQGTYKFFGRLSKILGIRQWGNSYSKCSLELMECYFFEGKEQLSIGTANNSNPIVFTR